MSGELEQGLKSLLSSAVSGRVYPRLPQPATLPAIRYQRIYTNRKSSIDGSGVGVTEVGMQVDCMAETYEGAKTLADAVRVILHTYTGTWGTLKCRWCALETENDMDSIDGDNITHWVAQRYTIYTNMD